MNKKLQSILKKFCVKKYENSFLTKNKNDLYFFILDKNYTILHTIKTSCKDFYNDIIQMEKGKIYSLKIYLYFNILKETNINDIPLDECLKITNGKFLKICDLDKKTITEIEPFIGDEEVRFYLNGININPNQEIVATNGHILYKKHLLVKNLNSKEEGIVIQKPLLKDDTELFFNMKNNIVLYRYDDFTVYSRIVSDSYVEYRLTLNKTKDYKNFKTFKFNIEDFKTLDFTNKYFQEVIFKNNKLFYNNTIYDIKKEQELTFNFNLNVVLSYKYLQNCLKCFDVGKVIFKIHNSDNINNFIKDDPVLFYQEDKEILLMPIKQDY